MNYSHLIHRLLFLSFLTLVSCGESEDLSQDDFKVLMMNIAVGWSTQDTDLALSSFHEQAIYMEPPNIQFYKGHEQLRPYFDALTEEYNMEFHNLWFNEETQTGAGEYTFSYGKEIADTGIAVIELENGKIVFWREYQKKGPVRFSDYIGTQNKNWEWHIGNYPEPKDSLNPK